MSFKRFSFFVSGIPATAGSKKVFVNQKTGKPSVVDTCKRGPSWRESVRQSALKATEGTYLREVLIDEPIELNVVFYFIRPKSHFRTSEKFKGQIKPTAPNWPTKPPDVTKLLRAIEDALTEVVWRDDASIVVQSARKVYANHPGALVTVSSALYPSDYEESSSTRQARMQAIMDGMTDEDGS